jgi:putative acetyltransferase
VFTRPPIKAAGYIIRRAAESDADALAELHGDSVRTLGALHYSPEVTAEWGAPREGSRYRAGMARGVMFFIAVQSATTARESVLGFSSYAVDGERHSIGVYVGGSAARQGVGRRLFEIAEAAARTVGAPAIAIEAALGAVPFWTAVGFERLEAMAHQFPNGQLMTCIRMHKRLT